MDVDAGDHLLDLLACVADHHAHAGRGAPCPAVPGVAGHVTRDAAVLVSQGGELLVHPHQLGGVAVGLEETYRCRA